MAAEARVAAGTSADAGVADGFDADADRGSVTTAPEVVGLEFHYFDGEQWSSDWDSWQRRSLPLAVEVAMQIAAPERDPRRGLAAKSADLDARDDAGKELKVHRLVVYLPAATATRPE